VSHTLDERWGISPPWHACDSGADLDSPGYDVLRGWSHVRLVVSNSLHGDVPLSGLLRTTWDALELFGALALEGVDAIVPAADVGDLVWKRVAGSVLRDEDRVSTPLPRALVQAGRAWPTSPEIRWEPRVIMETLSELVDVYEVMGAQLVSYPPSAIEHPFGSSDDDPFRAEVSLPAWTIDDAAWLAEAACAACNRAGVRQDVQVAVRRLI